MIVSKMPNGDHYRVQHCILIPEDYPFGPGFIKALFPDATVAIRFVLAWARAPAVGFEGPQPIMMRRSHKLSEWTDAGEYTMMRHAVDIIVLL